jgi:phosphate-selective porin OprO and OprP
MKRSGIREPWCLVVLDSATLHRGYLLALLAMTVIPLPNTIARHVSSHPLPFLISLFRHFPANLYFFSYAPVFYARTAFASAYNSYIIRAFFLTLKERPGMPTYLARMSVGKGDSLMQRRKITKCFLAVLLALFCTGEAAAGEKAAADGKAAAAEKSVAQEILDILRANNQIDAQQYDTLLSKAKAEEAKRQEGGKKTPNAMQASWKDGLTLEGGDDAKFKLQIAGLLQLDWGMVSGNRKLTPVLKESSGTQVRRARLSVLGTLYDRVDYRFESDFANGQSKIRDAYLRINQLPWVGNLWVGHFKEPFSLTDMSGTKYITFLERPMSVDAFLVSRNMGVMLQNTAFNKRMTWSIGGFRETDDQGRSFSADSAYNMTMRLTGLPWYEEHGRKLVHLGLSYSHRFRHGDNVRFSMRPEVNLTPFFVTTGDITSDGVDLLNPEFAMVHGPFSFQTEYTKTFVSTPTGKNLDFSGYYLEAAYVLTGEHREYRENTGAFNGITPKRNFDGQGGWGAWELAVRYSSLDLDDATVRGGKLRGINTGVSWYLNPNVRLLANYSISDGRTGSKSFGDMSAFQVRAQVAF